MLEVRADADGRVLSVQVLGAGASGGWSQVAAELLRRLQGTQLRLRPGAQGMTAHLRIERGAFTRQPRAIRKTPQGVAIGQESPSFAYDQSVQTLREGGSLPPLLGASSAWLRSSVPTKIQVLSLTFL